MSGNKPNEASKFSAVPRGRGEQQAARFIRAMRRRKHAPASEVKALHDMVASMLWERRVA